MKPDNIKYGKEYLGASSWPVVAVGEHNGRIVGLEWNEYDRRWVATTFASEDLNEWQDMPTAFSGTIYVGWLANGRCYVVGRTDLGVSEKEYVAIKRVDVSANKGEFDLPPKEGA